MSVAYYEPELDFNAPPAQDDLAQRFEAFDKAHREVYFAIRNSVFRKANEGARRISMKGIFEELRGSFGGLRLNNSFTSFYTDKIISECPELAVRFERRRRPERKMKLVYTK